MYTWNDKRQFIGDWKNNKMDGEGTFIWPDERKYQGQYKDDKKEGYGVFEWYCLTFKTFIGMMGENIKVNGKTVNNMETESSSILESNYGRKVFGVKESGLDGLMRILARINIFWKILNF